MLELEGIDDPEDTKEDVYPGKITYEFDLNKEIIITPDKLDYLSKWTKVLFWEDTKVGFKFKVQGKQWKNWKK